MQPPLPLQEFLPEQPLSPAWQPPLPLQLFWPLQSCLPVSPLGALVPGELVLVSCALATTPDSNPVMAAAMRSVRCVLFIIFVLWFQFSRQILIRRDGVTKMRVVRQRFIPENISEPPEIGRTPCKSLMAA